MYSVRVAAVTMANRNTQNPDAHPIQRVRFTILENTKICWKEREDGAKDD